MKKMALTTLLVALLAGCSDFPAKEAAIEDRGIKADAGQAPAGDATGKPAGAQQADGKSGLPAGKDGGAAAPGEKVETHGLAADATQVKSLEGKDAAAAGGAGAPGAAAGQAGGPVISLNLKDPQSPLAQRRIQFDYDSAAIRDEYRSLLEAHALYLKSDSAAKAILQGHADERGSREYNLALGQRRSESVFKALNLLGVPDGQLEAVSLGEEKPLAEGHDEAAWTQNRRVEILYQGE